MMRRLSTILAILLLFSSKLLTATEQSADLLIYKSDTIFIDQFPLDVLAQKSSVIADKINDPNCLSTDCWRQHIGTWEIENDRLYLIALRDCCDRKNIPLGKIFDNESIKNGKVFASWYSESLESGFGELLGFDETNWKNIYKKTITLKIEEGVVKKLDVLTKESKN